MGRIEGKFNGKNVRISLAIFARLSQSHRVERSIKNSRRVDRETPAEVACSFAIEREREREGGERERGKKCKCNVLLSICGARYFITHTHNRGYRFYLIQVSEARAFVHTRVREKLFDSPDPSFLFFFFIIISARSSLSIPRV